MELSLVGLGGGNWNGTAAGLGQGPYKLQGGAPQQQNRSGSGRGLRRRETEGRGDPENGAETSPYAPTNIFF